MRNPLVSIVVAVYNTEAYLPRCIQSVLAQTYENWELILIDDGSTDGSLGVCEKFAEQDSRIFVYHQENGGVARVRNFGIATHKGEYLTFLDSDDLLAPDTISDMLDVALSENADIVECDYVRFGTDSELAELLELASKTDTAIKNYTSKEFLSELIAEKKMHQLVCGKLYHKPVLIIPFPEGKFVEDEYWTFRTIDVANKITILEKPFYLYYFRPDSTMNARYSKRRIDGFFALCDRHQYVSEKYADLIVLSARSLFGAGMFHYQMLLAHKDVDPDGAYRRSIIKEMRALPFEKWKKNLPFKQQIWQSTFRVWPSLVGRVRNLFKIGW